MNKVEEMLPPASGAGRAYDLARKECKAETAAALKDFVVRITSKREASPDELHAAVRFADIIFEYC